ncbi:hypothetical protein ETAA8_34610 [Anatilimnocola aggregata]|uniref:Periplasmic folding chaperone n=1 Tax=Anatilimnocola aggregata TaxID=2528021 RepID=A0A517YDQ4_9BACT|nr:hypothetical protein [Anatilimnocola aggregata]QDU28361.1 hypothetical protein ETAA8_34610 [Anatilimnocola aggregata]
MLHHIRQNSKILLAVFGVILIIAWLVLPAIQGMYDSAGGGSQRDPVVVTWKGGKLTAGELRHLRAVHNTTLQFILSIIQETRTRGGTPRAPGYMMLMPEQQWVGISPYMNEESLVNTQILAQRARAMGVVASDETVKQFLIKMSDFMLNERDLAELVAKAIPDAAIMVTQGSVFEHLKDEILSQQMQIMAQAGVNTLTPGDLTNVRLRFGDHGLLPPGEMWNLYERFNRKVAIQAYPLEVTKFLEQVKTQPTEEELKKLFEEGRMLPPNPEFPEPGFRQPHRVAFEYVKVETAPFLEAAKKEITDEQIAAEYEKGKAAGRFKVEEKPAETPMDKKPEETPADPNAPKDPADPAKPDDKKPEEKKPEEAKPDDKKPAEAKPEEKKPEEKPVDDTKKAAEPKKNEGSAILRDVQLVNFQNDEPKAKTETKQAEETKKDEPAKPAETKPADPKPETKPEEAKPAETKPTDPAATTPATPEPAKEVKFKPLDEVKEEIRTQLAQPIAAERRQAVIGKIVAAVNTYARQFNRWKAHQDRIKLDKQAAKVDVPKPAPLDLAAILGDAKAKVEIVPLSDVYEIRKFELGRDANRFDTQTFQQYPFAAVAYQENASTYLPETLPFSFDNKQFVGLSPTIWVYWRTDEQPAKELTFKEAREQVLAAWKRKEAIKLAEAEGKKLAEQAAAKMDLKAVVDPKLVVEPPPFTWMTTGALGEQFNQAAPTISAVQGIPFAGQDFMQSVFDLKVGEAGTALNQPHDTVWVVRLVSEETDLARDRARFIETASTPTMLDSAFGVESQLQRELYQELFKEFNVQWVPAYLTGEQEETN